MGRIRKGTTFGLTIREAKAARLLALGTSFEDTACQVWGGDPDSEDPAEKTKVRKSKKTLRTWMQDPKFQEIYKAIIMEAVYPAYGEALQAIKKQIADSNGWLANKASNDIMTRFQDMVFGTEKDDDSITIKVESGIQLGVPPRGEDTAEASDDSSD